MVQRDDVRKHQHHGKFCDLAWLQGTHPRQHQPPLSLIHIFCALLHDLCKANYYKKGTRNVKNDATGQWEKVPSYSVEDLFPLSLIHI